MRTQIATLVLSLMLLGCRQATAPQRGCPQPPVIAAGAGVADFRQRIARQVAATRPDTVLDVVLRFAGDYTSEDRDRVAAFDGAIVYEFRAQPSLGTRFPARRLGEFVAADSGRLTDASLGLVLCNAIRSSS